MRATPHHRNEDGYVLVSGLVVLVMLTVIGITGTTTTSVELQIAANDKFGKMAFQLADGAAEVATELLEQNIEYRGFSSSSVGNTGAASIYYADGTDNSLDFYANEEESTASANVPTGGNYDIKVTSSGVGDAYTRVYGNAQLSTGSALQLSAGYEGKGKGIAGGGASVVYDVRSLAEGPSNSRARVLKRWRHVL